MESRTEIMLFALGSITKIIKSLANDPQPNGSENLSGEEKYRICKGPYRIIYSIEGNELVIWAVKIAHRKEVYR